MKRLRGFRDAGLDHRLHELPLRDSPLRRGARAARSTTTSTRSISPIRRSCSTTRSDGHGFLAIAPDDSSVMLLDCARMAGVWSLERAQRASKPELLREALAIPGLYGPLAGDWNARDGEYRAGRSKLLHYTTLHTQPWRPFPEQLVYQENAHAELWHDLERDADAAGFEPFTRARPSAHWIALGSPTRLEDAPDDDVPWLLDERFRAGPRARADPLRAARARTRRRASSARRTGGRAASRPPPGDTRRRAWEIELLVPGRADSWHRAGGPRTLGAAAERLGARRRPPRATPRSPPGSPTRSAGPTRSSGCSPGPLSRLHNRLLGASRVGIDARALLAARASLARARDRRRTAHRPRRALDPRAVGRAHAPRPARAQGRRPRRSLRPGGDARLLPPVPASEAHRDERDAARREPRPPRRGGGALEAAARSGARAAHRAAGRRHLGSVPARRRRSRADSRRT